MALQAIALGVAGNTALETLPGRLAVAGEEELLGIVIPTAQRPPRRHEAHRLVAVGAEHRRVVALAAGVLAVIRRRRVLAQKPRRVEARGAGGGVRAVAAQAVRAHVARGTILRG